MTDDPSIGMKSTSPRVGVWLIGAHGGLATTIMVGAHLLARNLVPKTGLLTETEPFRHLDLIPVESLVFGGHDIRQSTVFGTAREIYRQTGTFDPELLETVRDDLGAIDGRIRSGSSLNCGPAVEKLGEDPNGVSSRGARGRKAPKKSLRGIVERLRDDILEFQRSLDLESVVVVNVASTEPPLEADPRHDTPEGLAKLLDARTTKGVRASILYGYAAISAGCPFINFTPNAGSLVLGLQTMAKERKIPVMGNDGKTGETLVKSALAPMFKYRNLRVLSWQGYNILGDGDGRVLSDERHKKAKVASKDGLLPKILGYPLHTHVGIDYVPSLQDLKTAWDFIHFEGFLGFKMSLQFIWQGCDSILAAPLILDMIRLSHRSHGRGEGGLMTWLSCFFKSPLGVEEHDLHFQFHHLLDYVANTTSARKGPRRKKSPGA